jgi:hypothetical protein
MESMTIRINKDFLEEYPDDVWKGFSSKETLTIAVAGIIGAAITVVLFLKFHITASMAVYVAIPTIIPILFLGFFKSQGYLPLKELIQEILFSYDCKNIFFSSNEEDFTDTNLRACFKPLNQTEGEIYGFDVESHSSLQR